MKHIPNLITSLNLTCGFFAIIYSLHGDSTTASWLILAAMVFDFFDGFSARLLKAYSDIGKELDSLADVVSFGVAPGIIIYQLIEGSLMSSGLHPWNNSLLITLIVIIPAVMPVCAALRLAIFNLDMSQTTVFKGLPTPANALAVISVVLASHYSKSHLIDSFINSPVSLTIFTIGLSLLMVSRITLLSLKFSNMKLKGNEGRFLMIALISLAFVIFGMGAAPLVIPIYLISSLVSPLF